VVLDDAVEEKANGEKARMGMVVCFVFRLQTRFSRDTSIYVYKGVRACRYLVSLGRRRKYEGKGMREDEANTLFPIQVIRGNSVVLLEALERIGGDDRRGGGDHRG